MGNLIKHVRNLHTIEFDRGRFDEWCVYLERKGQPKYAPGDVEYFQIFQQKGKIHGAEKVYNDFVSIYERTSQQVDGEVLNLITTIADTYLEDAIEMDIWFSVVYGGMIAEENKKHAILKKRIKRLGIHQVLIENFDPQIAARFSYQKKWRELDGLMRGRGF